MDFEDFARQAPRKIEKRFQQSAARNPFTIVKRSSSLDTANPPAFEPVLCAEDFHGHKPTFPNNPHPGVTDGEIPGTAIEAQHRREFDGIVFSKK
jgi:hypothetical protein